MAGNKFREAIIKKEAVPEETASSKEVNKLSKYQIPNLYPIVNVNMFLIVLMFAITGLTFILTG